MGHGTRSDGAARFGAVFSGGGGWCSLLGDWKIPRTRRQECRGYVSGLGRGLAGALGRAGQGLETRDDIE